MKQRKTGFKINFDDLHDFEIKSFGGGNSLEIKQENDEERTKREQLLKEEYEIKMSEIINGRVLSENDILFIPLENINSSICYFISAIQRLHSSKTLNGIIKNCDLKHLIKNENVASDVEATLNSLKHYANINDDNIDKIFDSITKDHKILFESVFNQHMLNGGDTYKVLIWLLFPLLYIEFGIGIVKRIIDETNFDTNRFSGINSHDGIISIIEQSFDRLEPYYRRDNTNKFLREANKCFVSELNDYVSNINQRERKNKFVVGNMSLFFNNEEGEPSQNPGHAVVVIKSKDGKYVVIDDAVNVREISNYVQQCGKRINKLEFKDIDDEDIIEIKKLLEPCSVDARIYRTIIRFGNSNALLGGLDHNNDEEHEFNINISAISDSGIVNDGVVSDGDVVDNIEELPKNKEELQELIAKTVNQILNKNDVDIVDDVVDDVVDDGIVGDNNFINNQNQQLNQNQNIQQIQNQNQQLNQNQLQNQQTQTQTQNQQQLNQNIQQNTQHQLNQIQQPNQQQLTQNPQQNQLTQNIQNQNIQNHQIQNQHPQHQLTQNQPQTLNRKTINSFKDLYIVVSHKVWIDRTFIERCLLTIILCLIVAISIAVIVNSIKCKSTNDKIKEYYDKNKKIKKEIILLSKEEEEPTNDTPKFATQGNNVRITNDALQQLKPIIKDYSLELLQDVNKYSQNKPLNILELRNSAVLNKIISKKTNYAGLTTNEIIDFDKKPFEVSKDFIY